MHRYVRSSVSSSCVAALLFASGATAQQPGPGDLQKAVIQPLSILEQLRDATKGPALADQLALGEVQQAVPALAKAITEDYPTEVRWRAERALGAIGPGAADAVGGLIANLADSDERVRAYACYALGKIDAEPSQSAVPGLVERVTDENAVVRRAAVDALLALQPDRKIVLPLMARALQDAEPRIVMAAVRTLTTEGAAAVPLLAEALADDKSAYWAVVALESMGPEAAPATPALVKLISHNDPEIRMEALMALAAIGPEAKNAAPKIVEILESDSAEGVQFAAAYALGSIGAEDDRATAALTHALRSDTPLLAMLGAWALAKSRPDDAQLGETAGQLIANGLKSDNPTLQAAAARVLADTRNTSEVATTALYGALVDASPQVAIAAADALAAQGAHAVPWLTEALKNEKLRLYAMNVLKRIGPEASEAVPALASALQSDDAELRRELQFTLAAIGPAAAPAIPQLVKSLRDDDQEIRYSAIYALGRIGEQAKDACPELIELLQSDDQFTRVAAVWAMTRIDPGRPEIAEAGVPLLSEALQSERELLRAEAAATLGELGDSAKSALPALKEALNDPSTEVRQAAQRALERLEQR